LSSFQGIKYVIDNIDVINNHISQFFKLLFGFAKRTTALQMFFNVQRVNVLFVVSIELTGGRMNRLIDLRPVELALHHSVIFQSIIFIEVRFCPKILDFTFKVASIVRTFVHLGLKNHKAFRLVFRHFFDSLV